MFMKNVICAAGITEAKKSKEQELAELREKVKDYERLENLVREEINRAKDVRECALNIYFDMNRDEESRMKYSDEILMCDGKITALLEVLNSLERVSGHEHETIFES